MLVAAATVAAAGAGLWAAGRGRPFRLDVRGGSMEPTLRDGEGAIAVRGRAPRAGHVVVVEHPGRPGFEMVKRLAEVRDGGWWVVGDALEASTDSRHFGAVSRGAIVGRVLVVYRPLWRARLVR